MPAIPSINNNSLIQIGGLEAAQCGMRADASSAHNRRNAPTLHSRSSPLPKPQLEQELSYDYLKLNASVSDVSLNTVGDACLDEENMKACAQLPVDTGNTSLVWSGSQLRHGVSLGYWPSLPQPFKTVL